jgi:hypothetical protein
MVVTLSLSILHSVSYIVRNFATMSIATKRKHSSEIDEASHLNPRSVCAEIRKLGLSVGEFLLEMVQDEHLTLTQLKAMKERLPAFSSAEWEKVAVVFDLRPTLDKYQLQAFTVPNAYLPPSHTRVMKSAVQWMSAVQWLDVYQDRGSQKREAARVRLMDAVCSFSSYAKEF